MSSSLTLTLPLNAAVQRALRRQAEAQGKSMAEVAREILEKALLVEPSASTDEKRHQIREREARDLEILNQRADVLNREVEDLLAYQIEL